MSEARGAWRRLPALMRQVNPPVFPQADFNALEYGADPQGQRGCRAAIQRAIEVCHRQGGGRVSLPPGVYLCDGPLHLLSGVNLHVQEGAVLRFDTVADLYLPAVKVRWEGVVCYNYSPLIYAIGQERIGLTGKGRIEGQGRAYWNAWRKLQPAAQKRLRLMGATETPEQSRVFGAGDFLRPTMVEFYECQNILIEDLTFADSPFWTIHPVFSKNITIRNLVVKGYFWNDDGIDPDSCEDVLIENCDVETHDDAISIKAGRDQDAWSRPGARRIWVRNCRLRSEKANALCIGSELSGGVEQVFFEKCRISSARYGFNNKTNSDRGGFVRNVHLRDIMADTCREQLIFFQTNYHSYRGGQFPTKLDCFFFTDVVVAHTDSAFIRIDGLAEAPIGRIWLSGVGVLQPNRRPLSIKHAQIIRGRRQTNGS